MSNILDWKRKRRIKMPLEPTKEEYNSICVKKDKDDIIINWPEFELFTQKINSSLKDAFKKGSVIDIRMDKNLILIGY